MASTTSDASVRRPETSEHQQREEESSSQHQDGGQTNADVDPVLDGPGGLSGWYARQLIKLPVAIAMCIGLLVLTAVCGAVSLLLYDAPEFSEPTKGFEARGTDVNARMISFSNLFNDGDLTSYYVVNSTDMLRPTDRTMNEPSTQDPPSVTSMSGTTIGTAGRARREAMPKNGSEVPDGVHFCPYSNWRPDANFNQPSVVFEAVGDNRLFSRRALLSMCSQYEEHISNTPAMLSGCCGVGTKCTDSWSLGNFVAVLNDRRSCQEVREEDVERTQELLERCAPFYQRDALRNCLDESTECPRDVPAECLAHDHAVYFIFHYLVPFEFAANANRGNFDLASTMMFLPIIFNQRAVYDESFAGSRIDDGVTKVVALGLEIKFELFSDFLLSDTLYIGIGAGLVFVIIWIYTVSLFITVMTILSMLMSLVFAYFAFVVVFGLPFFPFVNIASAVLIIGIGADDTFVYVDIWDQTKKAHSEAHRSLILRETLRHASVTMFVTSFTTASALYSGAVSSITAVRCFGVYGGTAIIVNFMLTLTWLPAVVVIHSRFQDFCASVSNPCPGCLRKLHSVHVAVARAYRSLFEKFLPVVVLRLRYVWIVIFTSLGVGAFCVVFVSPKLELPTSAEFQVFRDSDLFELYDSVYKPRYDFNIEGKDPLFVAAVFGVQAVDNGNHWDPNDRGSLALLDDFDMFNPDAQEFLLEFCHSFRNQSFYDAEKDTRPCFMDGFRSMMEASCNLAFGLVSPCCGQTSFPYPSDIFEGCLKATRTCDAATRPCINVFPGPLFSATDGKVKAFFLYGTSSKTDTMKYNYIHEFWTEANAWLDGKLESKPTGVKGGWMHAGSSGYGQQPYFYNLQHALASNTPISMGLSLGIAALVLLLTTWNLLVSLYAMFSIAGAFCVTVGTLVLLGWRLNIFESAILSLAVGLSVDFTIHYGVAYRLAQSKKREERTLKSLTTVGSAITVAALSTFVAGAMMMPSTVITYVQLGIFLMLVMTVSWAYATFFFLSLCRVIGPVGSFAQIPFPTCCSSSSGKTRVSSGEENGGALLGDGLPGDPEKAGIKMVNYKETDNENLSNGRLVDKSHQTDSLPSELMDACQLPQQPSIY